MRAHVLSVFSLQRIATWQHVVQVSTRISLCSYRSWHVEDTPQQCERCCLLSLRVLCLCAYDLLLQYQVSPRYPFGCAAIATLCCALFIYALKPSYNAGMVALDRVCETSLFQEHLRQIVGGESPGKDSPQAAGPEVWNNYVCEEFDEKASASCLTRLDRSPTRVRKRCTCCFVCHRSPILSQDSELSSFWLYCESMHTQKNTVASLKRINVCAAR
eukprot:2817781-Amphidinium_carterae.1